MFVLISYDIVDDKRRNKIAKILLDFGARVQYSVFECNLKEEQMKTLKRRLRNKCNEDEDSIRIYILEKDSVDKIEVIGKGVVTREKDVYIL